MIDYVHISIAPSTLDRTEKEGKPFQKGGQTIPEGRTNRSQKGTQPSQKWEDKLNWPQKWARKVTNRITESLTLKMIHIMEFGISQVSPVRVQDLVKSSCRPV